MLLLALLSAAATPPPQQQARAVVRIVRPARIGRAEWEKLPAERRRETIVTQDGHPQKVRLFHFE